MIIKQLIMKNFGKFTYKDIDFEEGMNIVYGPNEAGKSTVHSFIRGMLFGMEKKRGRVSKDNLYEKYKTWEGSTSFSGHMKVEDEGAMYDVSRVFDSVDKKLQCVDSVTGKDCVVDDKPAFLGDMTENKYRNTISNEQTKARVDKDLASEVKNYIANLTTSKDKEVDVANALNDLNNRKKLLLKKGTANEISDVASRVDRDIEDEKRLDQVIKESIEIRKKMKHDINEKEEESISILKDFVDEYDNVKKAYEELKKLEDEKKILEQIDDKAMMATRSKGDKLFFIIIALFSSAGVFFSLSKYGLDMDGIFISLLIVACAVVITYLFNDRVSAKLLKIECERNVKLEKSDREKKESINQGIIEKQNIILEYAKRICPLKSVDEDEMLRLEKEINVLRNQVEGHIYSREKEDSALKLEIEKCNWQIDMLEKDRDLRRQRKVQLEELKEVYNKEKKDVDALNIAMDAIGELSRTIHYSVSGDLNELISKYCNILTWGKYSKVRVGEEFNISVFGEEKYIDIDKLSVGTVEQIYLAVRLAVSELFWPDKKLPILLDESFAFYDNNRLKATLKALSRLKNRQVIIFTCHMREAEMLEDEGIDYNYVEL